VWIILVHQGRVNMDFVKEVLPHKLLKDQKSPQQSSLGFQPVAGHLGHQQFLGKLSSQGIRKVSTWTGKKKTIKQVKSIGVKEQFSQ